MRRIFFIACLFFYIQAFAQQNKVDNSPIGKLKRDVEFLTSPSLEGRLTGTAGASKAADYIETRFKGLGLEPFKLKYKWDFTVHTGLAFSKSAYFKVFEHKLEIGKDFVYLPYSQGNIIKGMSMPGVNEQGNLWLISARKIGLRESNNPQKLLFETSRDAFANGASSVVIFNDIDVSNDLSNLNLNTFDALEKPVVFLNYHVYLSDIKPNMRKDWIDIDSKLAYEDENTDGKNVIGMINNRAALTVIITANYDHLGNSNGNLVGADNNASGIAALLNVAENVKLLKLKKYNYLFIAFSGKEQSMQGSKAFLTQHETYIPSISCMINLDRLGRYNVKSKAYYVNGYGTSNLWDGIVTRANKLSNVIMIDSSGLGYSDMNSFYKKNIPVLSISTGYHDDYITANDNFNSINWNGLVGASAFLVNVITEVDNETKPTFSKTTEYIGKIEKNKRNLGLYIDFSYPKNGIRINYCLPNKLAAKAGLKYGDVITKIGPFKIIDIDDYMNAMNKIDKDIETTILILRNEVEYKFFVTFQ
jgi:aminopeptidase YwaD